VLDVLDHATATPGEGGKLALDLTAARPDREVRIADELKLPAWCTGADASLAAEWGAVVLFADRAAEADVADFLRENDTEGLNFVVVVDAEARGLTHEEMLWHVAGNTDPGRDMRLEGGTLLIDGRTKSPKREGYPRRVPNVVTADAKTIALVDRRWEEYGLGDRLASPSERFGALVGNDGAAAE
ncbi:menaquinone biosynthesis decarboxylase, partial [Alistipes sp. OttesenSCG-928-B03]|nr:menaquinone biosynthesis decarboxylase [Alistipes sp. OttesenSCG-928-B03]